MTRALLDRSETKLHSLSQGSPDISRAHSRAPTAYASLQQSERTKETSNQSDQNIFSKFSKKKFCEILGLNCTKGPNCGQKVKNCLIKYTLLYFLSLKFWFKWWKNFYNCGNSGHTKLMLKPCACDLSRRLTSARPDINQFNELLFDNCRS